MKNKIILSALAGFVLILCSSFRYFPPSGYAVGDKIKPFSLKNTDGKMVALPNDKASAGAIIVFTCNHCPFSQAYESRIINLDKEFAPKGYPVIAINSNDKSIEPDDSFEKMQERATQHKYPFPYLYDETQEVATTFGAARTPHVFVLQRKNDDYIIRYIGAIDDNADEPASATKHYVKDAVNSLIAGKDVEPKTTKAVGCTIKWKK